MSFSFKTPKLLQ